VITHDDHLLRIGQVDPDDRVARRHQDAQPTEPGVAIAVTPRHTTTVTHERPPYAWDTKPEAHQEDVPSSCNDTQNVFLCRGWCAKLANRARLGDRLGRFCHEDARPAVSVQTGPVG
jgi:hypothetical protein